MSFAGDDDELNLAAELSVASHQFACVSLEGDGLVTVSVNVQDRDAGRKIAAPTLVLWGSDYLGRGDVPPLEVWQRWCLSVVGREILSGHFLAEENPEDTAAAILDFLRD